METVNQGNVSSGQSSVPLPSTSAATPMILDPDNAVMERVISSKTSMKLARCTAVGQFSKPVMTEDPFYMLKECSTMTLHDISGNQSGIDSCLKIVNSESDNISLADLLKQVTDCYNNPNLKRLTFLKDMRKKKFSLESVEKEVINRQPIPAQPDSKSGEVPTPPTEQRSDVPEKVPITPRTARRIMNNRLIDQFEARTGQRVHRGVEVAIKPLNMEFIQKFCSERTPKTKTPWVDGSDSGSYDDTVVSANKPNLRKRFKSRYDPLDPKFVKSPKSEASTSASLGSPGNTAVLRRSKRCSARLPNVGFGNTPSGNQLTQGTSSSSS